MSSTNFEYSLISSFCSKWHRIMLVILLLLFALGIGIRLFDLTAPPFDFNPTRQLRGAIIARGIYYQMLPDANPLKKDFAIRSMENMAEYEPNILEWVVALVYLLVGGEYFWIARIVNTMIWMVGAWFLFQLGCRVSSVEASLTALGFYLFLPFSVYASRSFQPDPLMTTFIVLSVYATYRWAEKHEWQWAIWCGIFGGAAALVKIAAAYFISGMLLAIVIGHIGLLRAIKDKQIWLIVFLVISPAAYFYFFRNGQQITGYLQIYGDTLSSIVVKPRFYFQWLTRLKSLINPVILFLAVLGTVLSSQKLRLILIGMWVGYLSYGLLAPRIITTHDYYSIQLIPIVAVSLLPLAEILFRSAAAQAKLWQLSLIAALSFVMVFSLWIARSTLIGQDYHDEAKYWQDLGEKLPDQFDIIALTQHYGLPLNYFGWHNVDLWPVTRQFKAAKQRGVQKEFNDLYNARIKKNDMFLVTSSNQLNKQPLLKEVLNQYPILLKGGGIKIYDLRELP